MPHFFQEGIALRSGGVTLQSTHDHSYKTGIYLQMIVTTVTPDGFP
ncbi:MAG: hypothetical protein ACJAUA_000461 [Zhongshania aliphaticivorans]|jgi:hypothetical protein